jgi:hypothetical protein
VGAERSLLELPMILNFYLLLLAIAGGLAIYAGVSKPPVLWVAVLLIVLALALQAGAR